MVILLVLTITIWLILYLLYHSSRSFKIKFNHYRFMVQDSIFWNGLIRFYLQGFLKQSMIIVTFFAAIYHQELTIATKAKLGFNSALCLGIFIIIPILIYRTLEKYKFELELD